jgi:hypothetical protein
MKISDRHIAPYAESCATRHGIWQSRQIGPHVVLKLAYAQIPPIAAGPLRRRLLKRRLALAAPGSQKRPFLHGPPGSLEEIRVKHVVVIHENQQITLGLAYAPQASRSKTEGFLANHAGARMPGEIHAIRKRCVASIVHDLEFPRTQRQSLGAQRLEAL